MSKQKMREEFEAWMGSPIHTDSITRGSWKAWQAACASKQQEIDSLQRVYTSECAIRNRRGEMLLERDKQIRELAAQVEVMRAVPLSMRCEAEGNSRRGKCEPTRAIVLRDVANSLERILSTAPTRSPSQAEGE